MEPCILQDKFIHSKTPESNPDKLSGFISNKVVTAEALEGRVGRRRIDREGGSSELLDASSGCCSGSLNSGPRLSMSLIQTTLESAISKSKVALAAGGGHCVQWKQYHWAFNNADAG